MRKSVIIPFDTDEPRALPAPKESFPLAVRAPQAIARKTEMVPPSDAAAEKSVLGCMMISDKAADVVFDLLDAEVFYQPRNRWLFKHFTRIFLKHATLDILIVKNELKGQSGIKRFDELEAYLMSCIIDTGSAANVEQYCGLVRKLQGERRSVELATIVIRNVEQGKDAGEMAAQLGDHIEAIAPSATQNVDMARMAHKQKLDEISGKRFNIAWPGFVCLSSVQPMLPDSMALICGSPGASKSFMAVELLWRLLETGISAAYLALDKDPVSHFQRAKAQKAECGDFLDTRWTKANPERTHEIESQVAEFCQTLQTQRAIQGLERKSVSNVIRWLAQEFRNGRQLCIVDSVSAISADDRKAWTEENRLIEDTRNILAKYGARVIFVVHPKKDADHKHPTLGDMKGTEKWGSQSDAIFWLEWMPDTLEDRFDVVDSFGNRMLDHQCCQYNRIVHILKRRDGKQLGRKVAVYCDSAKLHHVERGWL